MGKGIGIQKCSYPIAKKKKKKKVRGDGPRKQAGAVNGGAENAKGEGSMTFFLKILAGAIC